MLAQVARAVFPPGSPEASGFFIVQAFTLRSWSRGQQPPSKVPAPDGLLARDRLVPRAFANLGPPRLLERHRAATLVAGSC